MYSCCYAVRGLKLRNKANPKLQVAESLETETPKMHFTFLVGASKTFRPDRGDKGFG
jgi:hypothetical protein